MNKKDFLNSILGIRIITEVDPNEVLTPINEQLGLAEREKKNVVSGRNYPIKDEN